MTRAELVHKLEALFDAEQEIMILDGFNAGGFPRTINVYGYHTITDEDASECDDCSGHSYETVGVLGYGCY